MGARIMIIGPGDLARRLASGLSRDAGVGEVIMVGRRAGAGQALAALLAACGEVRVRFAEADAGSLSSLEHLLRRERPDLLVHCASLLSPWHLPTRRDPAAVTLSSAGFAAQLPAQLPLIKNLMEVVRGLDFRGPVVNCSYPDITNHILSRMGLAPTVGIGNVSMILARVRAVLRERGGASGDDAPPYRRVFVRALGHHSQVTAAMLSRPPEDAGLRPRVYVGEEARRADELAYAAAPLELNVGLNELSAASGLPVIRALIPGGAPLWTSAPGPLGLPGGYPISITGGRVELDLPAGLSLDEALAYQNRNAQPDGIQEVADDGTVTLTEPTRRRLSALDGRLAEPLHPSAAEQRFQILRAVLQT